MRGDELARPWRIIRSIEADAEGLTVAEIARREGIGLRTIYRDLIALQEARFPLYTEREDRTNRWAFEHISKFKVSTPCTLTVLVSEARFPRPRSLVRTLGRYRYPGPVSTGMRKAISTETR